MKLLRNGKAFCFTLPIVISLVKNSLVSTHYSIGFWNYSDSEIFLLSLIIIRLSSLHFFQIETASKLPKWKQGLKVKLELDKYWPYFLNIKFFSVSNDALSAFIHVLNFFYLKDDNIQKILRINILINPADKVYPYTLFVIIDLIIYVTSIISLSGCDRFQPKLLHLSRVQRSSRCYTAN